ncbi:GNAT family N-acetyltransferase [Micromonospora sp. PLK6-60]|uniref:GNAT family N-acetyltransferase n=1 Tax=Micromonospora sp. PLK6-60 TaxID=2873383 RepID=UPI001CA6A55C|nr:GNAT family N-acetyltransferase [Micromonospora sp. PLK6-60]MBY8873500.1 GNAT family N-acetyltransferase [Micromonospora sp. PLK6-60]
MSGLTVRPAGPADFPAVARLTVAAYEADGQLKDENSYATVLADVATRAAAGEVLVAVDDATGAVLGSVLFVLPGTPYAELSGPGEAEFRMLAVDPAAQGRGAGVALARACLDRAAELGATAVAICVREGMAARAHRLYERLGFVRTPEKDWEPVPGIRLLGLRCELVAGRSQAASGSV